MQKVYINGIGQVKIEENWNKSLRELAGEAALLAIEDSGGLEVEAIFIGNMMSGTANKQTQLGSYIADWLGLINRQSLSIEAACGSGSAAFRNAVLAVASNQITTALVIGVEKMTDSPTSEITRSLATAADTDLEVDMGISFVGINALLMNRYMYEYKWTATDFAEFSINAHNNALHNPFARFHKPISLTEYLNSPMVCDPINLMDASSIGDGSAAIVISSKPFVLNHNKNIYVAASSAATDTISLQNRKNPLWLSAAEISVKQAYSYAGISPDDIGVFEYHDAFSIMACLSLEACGFCNKGEGPKLANDGSILPKGRIPVATRGGLKARGHPVGATGIYQIIEVAQQLWVEATNTQVNETKYGMAQNIGGSGSNIITHILKSE